MQIFNELNYNKGLSLAFGFFDGVHLGHQEVIKNAVDFGKKCSAKSAIITFQDHPCCYFYDIQPKYIVRRHDKYKLFEDLGVDYLYNLKFDENIAHMPAEQYLKDIIIKYFEPVAITTGFNYFFGAKKSGDVDFLTNMQKEYNYKYIQVPPMLYDNEIVSSTRIREDIALGNFEMVNKMLGYNYFLVGNVVEGEKIGRTIGYKTANLIYPDILVLPAKGVYKVSVEYEGETYGGIANYGLRPTIAHDNKAILEVHIFDFDKEIYGEQIKVNFLKKIRDEKKFNSLDELKMQIQKDIDDSFR